MVIKAQIGTVAPVRRLEGIDRLDVVLRKQGHDGKVRLSAIQKDDRCRELVPLFRTTFTVDPDRDDFLFLVGGSGRGLGNKCQENHRSDQREEQPFHDAHPSGLG